MRSHGQIEMPEHFRAKVRQILAEDIQWMERFLNDLESSAAERCHTQGFERKLQFESRLMNISTACILLSKEPAGENSEALSDIRQSASEFSLEDLRTKLNNAARLAAS